MENTSDIILYQASSGEHKIDVRLENDTVWLNAHQMAELFQRDRTVIVKHIKNVYETQELQAESTCAKIAQVAKDGKKRQMDFYNLDMIISVGYRVNSHRGTQFRIWATQKLREYLVKGFVIDDERLKQGRTPQNYFDELLERVRNIRASERHFYDKVKDVFATSVDYNPRIEYAKHFFATVQNKFHFAITGFTATELVKKRIDGNKVNLGLTSWKGEIITRAQAKVAKNYLEELELKRLHLLVEQFLSFAELQSLEQRVMYMADWAKKLDDFLILNDKEVLQDRGSVSHQEMERHVRRELQKFNEQSRKTARQ